MLISVKFWQRLAAVFLMFVLTFCLFKAHHAKLSAASYDLTAKVSATIPSQAATIASPLAGQSFSSSIVPVSGVCQIASPANIVSLWRSGILIGSAVCSPSGSYSLNVTLEVGSNTLIARTENITNDFGPDSTQLVVVYSPPTSDIPRQNSPAKSIPQNSISDAPPAAAASVKIVSGVDFIRYVPGQEMALTIVVSSGVAPYTMLIDWGDGSSSVYTFEIAGEHIVKHTFNSNDVASIRAKITDANGTTYSMVLGAVTTAKASALTTSAEGGRGKDYSIFRKSAPYVAAGTASVTAVLLASSWLTSHGGAQAVISSINQSANRWRLRVKK